MNQSKSPSLEFHNIKGTKRTRLIQERKKRKLTQKELAKLLGVSSSLIGFIETARVKPSIEVCLALQEFYGLNFEELFPDL